MVNKKKTHRIGEITTNKNGHTIKIIEYNNNKDMKVLVVETGEIKKASYYNFIRGKVNSACVTKNNSIKNAMVSAIIVLTFIIVSVCVAVLSKVL